MLLATLKFKRKTWNRLKAECPEGWYAAYSDGKILVGCEDCAYFPFWYGLYSILDDWYNN